jgi:5-(carboxyamino)imidazole ribonucleotide synthase
MVNLIGDDLIKNLDTNGSAIHIYGKREIRKGRKMGHINYVIK